MTIDVRYYSRIDLQLLHPQANGDFLTPYYAAYDHIGGLSGYGPTYEAAMADLIHNLIAYSPVVDWECWTHSYIRSTAKQPFIHYEPYDISPDGDLVLSDDRSLAWCVSDGWNYGMAADYETAYIKYLECCKRSHERNHIDEDIYSICVS